VGKLENIDVGWTLRYYCGAILLDFQVGTLLEEEKKKKMGLRKIGVRITV